MYWVFLTAATKDLDDNMPTAIINSSGEVEICVKKGSAANMLQNGQGERVFVRGHLVECRSGDFITQL